MVDDHANAVLSELEEKVEVPMVGGQEAAALRLASAARHAPACLMDALRELDLPAQHACVCRVGRVTVQDAVVDVPAELPSIFQDGRLMCYLIFFGISSSTRLAEVGR